MMKNIKKLTAAVLAAAMLVLFAGCGGDQSWSYKTDVVSLTAGDYIYNLLNAYYEAYDLVESPDEVKKILEENVTDSDGNTKTVEQFSYDGADEATLRMLAVEQIMNDNAMTMDEAEYESAKSYASQIWGNVKDQFEKYGISQESFYYCYAEYTVKYSQVFEYVYGKDGEKYVNDDELIKYFKDNYTGYAYFGVSMATTDEEGNSVAKSDDEFEKTEEDLNGYIKSLNDGSKTYKDVVVQYAKDYEVTSDPTSSGAVKLDDCTLDASIVEALKNMQEGEASLVKTGEGATTMYYLVYKPALDSIIDFTEAAQDAASSDTDTETDTDTESGTDTDTVSDTDSSSDSDTEVQDIYVYDLKSGFNHYTLLNDYKSEEYVDYLTEIGKGLEYSTNPDVVGKFSPSMFVSSK